ncbi:MAG: 2-oxoglutarate ferredoxin oxidoreductase subunit gamma [Candidatus Abyssobacteria bacterium SURF_5]|uniref:2-oxoglutarate ferredoxin oxidoreductase subunit gamma n=1 Tax=Abyssobacteria bacterium (strain SURF_5) TaxID=2093360 RepID=A0A3A4P0E7_ABYX5|nr:MAG: 2-oxoglutarate ferredoxin oxidoreductase subunit gamma [Candidatus Abyssubacteria bacterium SURF_5]
MNERTEILASGFGGQGVVRLGQIIGEAGVRQGLRVSMLKSHGTEMRGGYVRSQVVLSPEIIDSPICESPDCFIALSGAAYNQFKRLMPDYGLILFDPAFVNETDSTLQCRQKAVPANELSVKHFDGPLFANSLMLGVVAAAVDILKQDIVLKSLLSVMPKFHDQNREAFRIGYDLFRK